MEQQGFAFSDKLVALPDEYVLHEVVTAGEEQAPFTVAFRSVRLSSAGAGTTLFVLPLETSREMRRPFVGFEGKMLELVRAKFPKIKDEEMIRTTLKVCHVDDDFNIHFKFRLREAPSPAVDPECLYNVKLTLAGLKIKRTRVETLWTATDIEQDIDLPIDEDDEEEEYLEEAEDDVEPAPDHDDVVAIRAGIDADIDAEEAELGRRVASIDALAGVLKNIRAALDDGGSLDDAVAVLEQYKATRSEMPL